MLTDHEYQLIIHENINYIFNNVKFEDIIIIDTKFRSEFLGLPFPRDIILEYIKYICLKIDKDDYFDKDAGNYTIVVIYNLLVKYYIDVSIDNIDICKYFKLELTRFNEIEIQIFKLLNYNFNCVDVTKWIEK